MDKQTKINELIIEALDTLGYMTVRNDYTDDFNNLTTELKTIISDTTDDWKLEYATTKCCKANKYELGDMIYCMICNEKAELNI